MRTGEPRGELEPGELEPKGDPPPGRMRECAPLTGPPRRGCMWCIGCEYGLLKSVGPKSTAEKRSAAFRSCRLATRETDWRVRSPSKVGLWSELCEGAVPPRSKPMPEDMARARAGRAQRGGVLGEGKRRV